MILYKDAVGYFEYQYKNETEIEEMIFDHSKKIFGEDSLLLSKRKIRAYSGIGTIPDAFVLSLDDKKWYLIEVELKNHPLYEHIVPQISKFNAAIKNSDSLKKLIKMIYEEIKNDPVKSLIFQLRSIKEIFKYITEILESKPKIIILIDGKNNELEEVCDSLPFKTKVIEFKTFCRENVGLGDHIHSFETLKNSQRFKSVLKNENIPKSIRNSDPCKKNENSVKIVIKNIDSAKKYKLFYFPKNIRDFFPGYKVPFTFETDIGEISTKITSAPKGTEIGDPSSGSYIQGGLKTWYEKHQELKNGDKLIITVVDPKKRYTLNIGE
ncbi:MAG: hypothetical protein U9N08_03835 [Candidatus Caldatribacteriota bacterium]|nr:hypothetical protein [Candidatus Caldatribacteriota bacterium]